MLFYKNRLLEMSSFFGPKPQAPMKSIQDDLPDILYKLNNHRAYLRDEARLIADEAARAPSDVRLDVCKAQHQADAALNILNATVTLIQSILPNVDALVKREAEPPIELLSEEEAREALKRPRLGPNRKPCA